MGKVEVGNYVRTLIEGDPTAAKNARDAFFLDPFTQLQNAGFDAADMAIFFSMDVTALSMHVAADFPDLPDKIHDYWYNRMEPDWPARGRLNEDPWTNPATVCVPPPAPPFGPMSMAAWAHPAPEFRFMRPMQGQVGAGTGGRPPVTLIIGGEGFLPGAQIYFKQKMHPHDPNPPFRPFGVTSDPREWRKCNFRQTYIRAALTIPGDAPVGKDFDAYVLNPGWVTPLKCKSGAFRVTR